MIFELKINSTFRLNSPFHSTGDVVSLKVDNPLSKDKSGNVIIPATLIKGTLRHNIEMTLRSLNKTVCSAPSPAEMCNKCIICKLFGSPSSKARLFFSDTKIFANEVILQTQTGTAIDRKTKTVREKALFSTEVSYYPDEFSVMIEGIFTNENDAIISAGLVLIGSRINFSIGRQKSRGLGWLELRDFKASINGQEIKIEKIENVMEKCLR